MYCVFSLLSGSANPAHHPPHFMLIKDKGTTTDRPALERHGVLSLVGVWLECSAEALDDRTTLPGLLARLHQWQSAVRVVRMKWRLRLPSAATDEVKAAAPRVNIALITAISDDSSLSSLMTHQCHTPPTPNIRFTTCSTAHKELHRRESDTGDSDAGGKGASKGAVKAKAAGKPAAAENWRRSGGSAGGGGG